MSHDRYFLGGHDLEMEEIRTLLVEAGLAGRLVDKALAWGARASAYESEIRAALVRGETPVLIELADDLPADIDRGVLVDIDHHGTRAGADQPTALEQIFARLGLPATAWTRRRALVAANDVGHAPALRGLGASAEEIRAIRDADRRAQGVTAAVEAESRRALATAERAGDLLIVRTTASTSSAIVDFVLPEYGGPGAEDLLVVMPDTVSFFGRGAVIERLKSIPGCWYGGALPERGYWGAPITGEESDRLVACVRRSFSAPTP
ncbi:hypothetical protein A33M_1559 [Rhodovulum sp. PH10]|nr:hypothetical protein A33M_1559 [Rhodovulum sp. PH10]